MPVFVLCVEFVVALMARPVVSFLHSRVMDSDDTAHEDQAPEDLDGNAANAAPESGESNPEPPKDTRGLLGAAYVDQLKGIADVVKATQLDQTRGLLGAAYVDQLKGIADVVKATQLDQTRGLLGAAYVDQLKSIAAVVKATQLDQFKSTRGLLGTAYIEQMLRVARLAADSSRLIWPANLRGVDGLDLEIVTTIVMDEGIPLFAVPSRSTAEALVNAGSYRERRIIIGNRWASITTDCESVLSSVESPALREGAAFALLIAKALRDGHAEAAQALAANLLDSMIREHFGAERIVLIPSRKVHTPVGYDGFIARKYIALAPIWRAFQSYWPDRGDPIPQAFARHATAHSVTRRQFSKRNAVQALMLVTGLLSFLETGGVG